MNSICMEISSGCEMGGSLNHSGREKKRGSLRGERREAWKTGED
jgi:hypothetical protein